MLLLIMSVACHDSDDSITLVIDTKEKAIDRPINIIEYVQFIS